MGQVLGLFLRLYIFCIAVSYYSENISLYYRYAWHPVHFFPAGIAPTDVHVGLRTSIDPIAGSGVKWSNLIRSIVGQSECCCSSTTLIEITDEIHGSSDITQFHDSLKVCKGRKGFLKLICYSDPSVALNPNCGLCAVFVQFWCRRNPTEKNGERKKVSIMLFVLYV